MKQNQQKEENKDETGLFKCKSCKYYTGKICNIPQSLSISGGKEVEDTSECINGFYESIDYQNILKVCYEDIIYLLDYYMDLDPKVKNIIALWTIGTYFHNKFESFPYLFGNAMRGSGKSRLLKIVNSLAKDSELTVSITESIVFRTTGTLCLDEIESIGSKEKTALRELLNASYKKGNKVFRMRKKKTMDGESQVVEEFSTYRPIFLCNIWGMEEVLNDRCITIILEKSFDPSKTKLIENFTDMEIVKNLREELSKCSLCNVVTEKNIYIEWNNYIKRMYMKDTTLKYINNITTTDYTRIHQEEKEKIKGEELLEKGYFIEFSGKNEILFKKIDETGIDGRNLELFMPLFLISSFIDEEILQLTIDTAKGIVQDRKIDEIIESKDVLVYSFISNESSDWRDVKELCSIFKLVIGEGDNEWCNPKWFGRALKRLSLVKEKRRIGKGIQVILNVKKAKEKSEFFKPKEN